VLVRSDSAAGQRHTHFTYHLLLVEKRLQRNALCPCERRLMQCMDHATGHDATPPAPVDICSCCRSGRDLRPHAAVCIYTLFLSALLGEEAKTSRDSAHHTPNFFRFLSLRSARASSKKNGVDFFYLRLQTRCT
jgi:hypothetical protein